MAYFFTAVLLVFGLSNHCFAANETSDRAKFETGGEVEASQFLPRRLQSGTHHTVSSQAESDGFQITYTLNSKYGTFKAVGKKGVEKAVAEINAIAELEAAANEAAFIAAVDAAGVEAAMTIAKAFTYPVTSVQGPEDGIPRLFVGTGRGFNLSRRLVRGGVANGNELTPEKFRSLNDLLGDHERILAQALKIDPYTTNLKLRRAVSALSAIKPPQELTNDISKANYQALVTPFLDQHELYKLSAAQLELNSRECLATMGVSSTAIDKFVSADFLTPTTRTAFCNGLSKLNAGVDTTALTTAMANSPSFEAADFVLEMIHLISWYQKQSGEADLTEITVSNGLPYGVLGESAVLFLPAENLRWTRIFANRVTALGADTGIVWLQGSISDRARAELGRRGWQINAIETLKPPGG